jgi:sulfur carrier protein ThiS
MDDTKKKPESAEKQSEDKPPLCSCNQDPFAALPPELRPRPKNLMGGLHKVTCPGCGLVYWTNRTIDLCVDCEKKGARLPDISEVKNQEPEVIKRGPMPARIRPLAQLKKYIGGQPEVAVEAGRTVRETLSLLSIPLDIVALIIVNGAPQDKDYCIQEGDEIKLFSVMSGG